MSESLVDWRLAARVAAGVAREPEDPPGGVPLPLRPDALGATCAEAEELVRTYGELHPRPGIPAPEALGRSGWSEAILATLRDLAIEVERENEITISLPGPLGAVARSLVGVATGTEVGLAAGYAARRVLGQYDLALIGAERPPRLLFVAPNLVATSSELNTELEPFVRWVALHETTHALQFASAPWLRDHLGGLVRTLLGSAAAGVGPGLGASVRKLVTAPREAVSGFLRGDLASALAGPQQAPVLERIQATMTLVEGHAEHVMDAAGPRFVPGVAELRRGLEARREARGPVETIIGRLLGLDLKLRQYRVGKEFCDGVVDRGGIEALNRVWARPDALPDGAELKDPVAWLDRTAALHAA